jgi:hypothetical protein
MLKTTRTHPYCQDLLRLLLPDPGPAQGGAAAAGGGPGGGGGARGGGGFGAEYG